jgi:ABC-type antimicrobial peptide transport system permease subunit
VSSIIGSISLLFSAIAGISLLVAAIGIMNVMLMSVMERTHEIGIMKSIGFKNKNVMLVFLLQALIIGVLGGLFGLAAGAGASYGLSALVAHASSSTTPTASTSSFGGGASGFGGSSPSFAGRETAPAGGGGEVFIASTGSAGGSRATSSSMGFTPAFTPTIIIEAIAIAIIVSVIAGLYPAWKASRMEPIDALREL